MLPISDLLVSKDSIYPGDERSEGKSTRRDPDAALPIATVRTINSPRPIPHGDRPDDHDFTRLEAEPRSAAEKIGDATGMLDRQVKTDLDKFKEFIESRGGQPTGAWRGEVNR